MQKLVADVLTAWRSAERLAADLSPGDPAHSSVIAAVEQLQAIFNDLTLASGARPEAAGGGVGQSPVHEISKDIAADARRLHAIETKKTRIPAGDARLVDLSVQAQQLGEDIAEKATAELEAAENAVG